MRVAHHAMWRCCCCLLLHAMTRAADLNDRIFNSHGFFTTCFLILGPSFGFVLVCFMCTAGTSEVCCTRTSSNQQRHPGSVADLLASLDGSRRQLAMAAWRGRHACEANVYWQPSAGEAALQDACHVALLWLPVVTCDDARCESLITLGVGCSDLRLGSCHVSDVFSCHH